MEVGLATTNEKSVPITNKVVSSNLAHGEIYSIQLYVINFSVTCGKWWFSPGTLVSSTKTTDRHYIIEILLKVT